MLPSDSPDALFCAFRSPQKIFLHPLDGAGLVLGDEQVGDDVVGDQIPLGGQRPAAVVALGGPGIGLVLLQDFFQRLKGKHEHPLVFLGGDAGVGPQTEHDVLSRPLPQRNFLDVLHDVAAGADAVDIALQIGNQGEPLAREIRAGAGAEA